MAPSTNDIEAVFCDMSTHIRDLIDAFSEVRSNQGSSGKLDEVARQISATRSNLRQAVGRPKVGVWKQMRVVFSSIDAFAATFFEVVGATTPIEAQEASRRMNAEIDAATVSLSRMRRLLDTFSELDTPQFSPANLAALALSNLELTQDSDDGILSFANAGVGILNQRIGLITSPPIGFFIPMIDVFAEAYLDAEIFWSETKQLVIFLREFHSEVLQLGSDITWRTTWEEQGRALWRTHQVARALFEKLTTDADSVFTSLLVCKELLEGIVKYSVATLEIVAGVKNTYENILSSGVTNLIGWAVSRNLEFAFALSPAIRNASAHSDYSFNSGRITLCPLKASVGQSVELTAPEFTDLVGAVVESSLAVWLAVTIALSDAGLDPPFPDSRDLLPTETLLEALLVSGGWSDVHVSVDRCVVKVQASNGRDFKMPEIASLVPALGDDINELRCDLQCAGIIRTVEFPVKMSRAVLGTSEEISETEFLKLRRAIIVDGEPSVSMAFVRKYISTQALKIAGEQSYKYASKGLAKLIHVARELGDPDLTDNLSRLLALLRSREVGTYADAFDPKNLTTWATSNAAESHLDG